MNEGDASFAPASLLEALNRHHVAYVLIGGVAARAHGATLRTGDLDICPQDSEANAERLAEALIELDAKVYVDDATPTLAAPLDAAFVRGQEIPNLISRFGRLAVIWHPAGVSGYDELAAGARTARLRGIPVAIADLDVLIVIEAATGRPKDREWLTQLRFIRDRGA